MFIKVDISKNMSIQFQSQTIWTKRVIQKNLTFIITKSECGGLSGKNVTHLLFPFREWKQ